MSCLCDTIARSLALVTIATGAAFVDWSFRPIASSLDAPKPILSTPSQVSVPDPSAETPESDTPATTDSDAGSGTGVGKPDAAGKQDVPGAGAFDPNTLGTKISTEETYQLWLTGAVIFIDARPEHEYLDGHIPYSFLIPPESIESGRLGALMEATGLSPADRVVIYCEGGSCNASELVGLTLQDMGFQTIHIDVDGYPGWVKAGHEVQKGPDSVLGELP